VHWNALDTGKPIQIDVEEATGRDVRAMGFGFSFFWRRYVLMYPLPLTCTPSSLFTNVARKCDDSLSIKGFGRSLAVRDVIWQDHRPSSPVLCDVDAILLAVLTVSPNVLNRGLEVPTTPAESLPELSPIFSLVG